MLLKLLALHRYPQFVRLGLWRILNISISRRVGIKLGTKVSFLGKPIISVVQNSNITIGDRVALCSVSEYTALGVNHPVILRTLRPGAEICIGSDTGISGASICAAVSIHIGKNCLFGANVVVTDTDFHALKAENRRYNNSIEDIAAAPVYIGNNVFLGTGSMILKGVVIGENSVVGAGCVVTKNIPPNSIAAGNPMQIVRRYLTDEFPESH